MIQLIMQRKIVDIIYNAAEVFFHIFFPSSCVSCNKIMSTDGFCVKCWSSLEFLDFPACKRCFFQFPLEVGDLCKKCEIKTYYCDTIRSPLRYTEQIKQLLLGFKNRNQLHLCGLLTNLMLRVATDEDFDCIVAVPLHPLRRIWRGYNQSEILVKEIAKKTKKPNLSRFLRRKRFTSSQGNFGKQGRLTNIKSAFLTEASFKNKRVLLVDDICTTGSTLEECAQVLKKAGAIKVHGITIAMT